MFTAHDDHSVAALLGRTQAGPDDLARLHHRLEQASQRDGLLDIAYRTLDTPVGVLLLAATEQGLVRIAYDREDHDAVLAGLAEKVSPRILRAPARLDQAARELDQYFARSRTVFDLPLDFTLAHGFRRVVQQYLPAIAYGQTQSYAQVAEQVGNPQAMRAVGSACATNALPIVVPCHRVIRADGTAGAYVGGSEAKAFLLGLEAA
jgi:methylated-DNA-[protein]-cysteine S-methyltransferase